MFRNKDGHIFFRLSSEIINFLGLHVLTRNCLVFYLFFNSNVLLGVHLALRLQSPCITKPDNAACICRIIDNFSKSNKLDVVCKTFIKHAFERSLCVKKGYAISAARVLSSNPEK